MTDLFERLAAEFPPQSIHWRAQTLTKDGDRALALAYLDARDVMDRLDEVCGQDGWSDSYVETAKGRVIATISVRTDGGWVSKSDGAGDTDIEGEKGGLSDAFKRAAVKWGIGRYLYRLPDVWAPCESQERNGRLHWKKWRGSPWSALPARSAATAAKPTSEPNETTKRMLAAISGAANLQSLYEWKALNGAAVNDSPDKRQLVNAFAEREAQLQPAKEAANG